MVSYLLDFYESEERILTHKDINLFNVPGKIVKRPTGVWKQRSQ